MVDWDSMYDLIFALNFAEKSVAFFEQEEREP